MALYMIFIRFTVSKRTCSTFENFEDRSLRLKFSILEYIYHQVLSMYVNKISDSPIPLEVSYTVKWSYGFLTYCNINLRIYILLFLHYFQVRSDLASEFRMIQIWNNQIGTYTLRYRHLIQFKQFFAVRLG